MNSDPLELATVALRLALDAIDRVGNAELDRQAVAAMLALVERSKAESTGIAVHKPLDCKRPEIQVNALRAAAEAAGPITVIELATKAGYRFNSYWQAAITSLVRDGLLERKGPGRVELSTVVEK